MRRVGRVSRWVLVALAAAQACRWVRVASSVPRYDRWWRALPRPPGSPLRYAALGDSLPQGVGASAAWRGFVGVLATALADTGGRRVEVVNLSRTGVMVHDVLRDQVPALLALDPPPDVVTVVIGTNDAGRAPHDDVVARFDALCAALPDGALVADLPRFHRGRRRRVAAELSAAFRAVVARHPRLVLVELDRATAATGLAHRSADLFHPNDRGHRLYAEVFLAAIGSRPPRA